MIEKTIQLVFVGMVLTYSVSGFSNTFYEATISHLDKKDDEAEEEDKRGDFNLLKELDWEAHRAAQPTDEELEAAGVTRDEINFIRPYIPGQRIKQLYPIMQDP